ncbi:MAG: hypothetical protein ACI85K_003586 [Hyphomicrobiaceae bacterium]|jgi:hypothetical protein
MVPESVAVVGPSFTSGAQATDCQELVSRVFVQQDATDGRSSTVIRYSSHCNWLWR